VRFGERQIRSFTDLEHAVASTVPGTAVPIEVMRDGKPVRLSLTPMERPSEDALQQRLQGDGPGNGEREPAQPAGVKSKHGLTIRPTADNKGVLVASVDPGSPAQEALLPGDVILQVDGTAVTSVDSFQKAINAAPAGGIVLRVKSINGLRFVVLRP
jgi:serine protease Do